MDRDLEETHRSGVPVVWKAAGAGVVVILAALVLHYILSFIFAIFWGIVAVTAVVAVIWVLKRLA
jgi:hypothetical protein